MIDLFKLCLQDLSEAGMQGLRDHGCKKFTPKLFDINSIPEFY